MHGHQYLLRCHLETEGPLREDGRMGGQELTALEQWVEETLVRQHLNEVLPDASRASVEDVAEWIVEVWRGRLPELVSVEVHQDDATSARVTVER